MIASTQIKNIEVFAFIAVLVFRLLSHEVKLLFINRKDNRSCQKVACFLRKFHGKIAAKL